MMLPWSVIEGVLRDYMPSRNVDKAHSIEGHMQPVYENARSIINIDLTHTRRLEINYDVLSIMVGFHDISRHVETTNPSINHAVKGAEEVRKLLENHDKATKYGLPILTSDEIQTIYEGIRSHRYSSNIRANSYEGSVLQDADRLEAVGKTGLERALKYGKKIGLPVHTPDILPNKKYISSGSASTVNHLLEKCLAINVDSFNTIGGKELCGDGMKIMQDFVKGEIRRAPFTKPLDKVHLNRLK